MSEEKMIETVKTLEELGFFNAYNGNFGLGVLRALKAGVITSDEQLALMEWAYSRGYPHDWHRPLVWSVV